MSQVAKSNDIASPPGGVIVWFIIFLELITFIAGIYFYFSYRSHELELFRQMQKNLNLVFGIMNTLFLVTSGYLVALSLENLKQSKKEKSLFYLFWGIVVGSGFIVLKSFEYHEKIQQGLTSSYNHFYTFYWFLTFFHFMHVVFATIILSVIYYRIKHSKESEIGTLEVGASLWHMCDLIWILLFPTLFYIR